MKRTMIIAGMSVVLAGTVIAPTAAQAEERTCRGTIGARTLDNVRVPSGALCVLNGTVVKGTIKVENGGRLRATAVRVVGNIQGEGHRRVVVLRSRVGGSIQLDQGRSAVVRRNRVIADVQSFSNRGEQVFALNRINGNLQCKQNNPAPTGFGNVVGGNKEDQCRRL
jgi:hypothetical protein